MHSRMSINSRVNVHICCFRMSLVVVNCPSLKRDKFTVLINLFYHILLHAVCYCTRYYSLLFWNAHLCIDCTSHYNTALYTAKVADVTILCGSWMYVDACSFNTHLLVYRTIVDAACSL